MKKLFLCITIGIFTATISAMNTEEKRVTVFFSTSYKARTTLLNSLVPYPDAITAPLNAKMEQIEKETAEKMNALALEYAYLFKLEDQQPVMTMNFETNSVFKDKKDQ